jgi:transcriptional regulator with XRE-family HTH domain
MDQFKLFGQRVRAIRKAAELTQEGTAERAGIAPNFLGYIERGEKRPSLEVVFALAKALGVPAQTFFSFDRTEMDEKTLRKRIHALLESANLEQLRGIYSNIKYIVEP